MLFVVVVVVGGGDGGGGVCVCVCARARLRACVRVCVVCFPYLLLKTKRLRCGQLIVYFTQEKRKNKSSRSIQITGFVVVVFPLSDTNIYVMVMSLVFLS